MASTELSPREEEIVALCVEGLNNEEIADHLGLSVGTINSYWMRIKLKVGGSGRTDTVVRIVKDKIERDLRDCNEEREFLAKTVAAHEQNTGVALALLNRAMDQFESAAWATDKDLSIRVVANGEFLSKYFGARWEVGKTVPEMFKAKDPEHTALVCHFRALQGEDCNTRLGGEFANNTLRVSPMTDESGQITGCISILHTVARDDR